MRARDFPARDRMSYRLVDEARRRRARRTPMAVEVAAARRPFTREEYHRMGEVGIHRTAALRLRQQFEPAAGSAFGRPRHRRGPGSHRSRRRHRARAGRRHHPAPPGALQGARGLRGGRALLLIEVAESSLAYDRSTKLRLYAAAGIPEYWVVDCVAETVEVHRTPDAGGYRDVSRVAGTGTVAVQVFPDVTLTLAEIFA